MSNKKFKIAFIGGAKNSAVGYAHFCACRMDNYFEIVAGCFSRDKNISEETGLIYGVSPERIYTDWRKMLIAEKNKIDAITVITPTPLHFEVVKEALKAGIPVICEKSLAMNPKEVKEIIEIQKRTNGFLAVTYNYTGYPIIRELRRLISKGKIGKILHFQAQMPQEGFIRLNKNGEKPIPQKWRLEDKTIPTIYLDLCSHLHEIIFYLINEKPVSVIADQSSDGWFENIIDNVSCLSRYTNNIQGQFWFSKSAIGHRNGLSISIFGTKGSVSWSQMNPEFAEISYIDGTKQILDRASNEILEADKLRYTRFKAGHPAGFIEAFANVYNDIYNALNEYKNTNQWKSSEIFGADLALEGMLFLEAMVKSSQSKNWQKVETNEFEFIEV